MTAAAGIGTVVAIGAVALTFAGGSAAIAAAILGAIAGASKDTGYAYGGMGTSLGSLASFAAAILSSGLVALVTVFAIPSLVALLSSVSTRNELAANADLLAMGKVDDGNVETIVMACNKQPNVLLAVVDAYFRLLLQAVTTVPAPQPVTVVENPSLRKKSSELEVPKLGPTLLPLRLPTEEVPPPASPPPATPPQPPAEPAQSPESPETP